MSSDTLSELPIQPALKITPSAVYVGDPKQLVDLLSSQVRLPPYNLLFCCANANAFCIRWLSP
jgi:hypothetical protein